MASSRTGLSLDGAGQDWLRTAAGGQPVLTSPVRVGDHIQWVIAQPILGADGHPAAVLVGELNPTLLATLLDPELSAGNTVVAVNAQHQLIYDTAMGKVADDTALLAAGSLSTTVNNAATTQATSTGQPGTARFSDLTGHDVIGGFDVVDGLHWIIIAETNASTVLAPVTSQRNRAILIVTLGALLAIGLSVLLAWRTTRPLRRLTDASSRAAHGELERPGASPGAIELVTLAESFNAMLDTTQALLEQTASAGVEVNSAAAELSASSDELAATTLSRAPRSPKRPPPPKSWPGPQPRSPTPSTKSPAKPPKPARTSNKPKPTSCCPANGPLALAGPRQRHRRAAGA